MRALLGTRSARVPGYALHGQVDGGAALHCIQGCAQLAQRRAQGSGILAGRLQHIRPGLEHSRGRRLHGAGRKADVAALDDVPRLDDGVQPVELVDQAHHRACGRAQPCRTVGRPQEPAVQVGDRRIRPGDRLLVLLGCRRVFPEQERGVRAKARGKRPAGGHGRPAQRVSRRCRPQHGDRDERRGRRHAPARESIRNRRHRAGQRDGQDEGQQQRRRRTSED